MAKTKKAARSRHSEGLSNGALWKLFSQLRRQELAGAVAVYAAAAEQEGDPRALHWAIKALVEAGILDD